MYLNKVWNWFYENTDNDYLCFLNNDIRLTDNFVNDTITVLDLEENVGCVIHATNHPNYNKKTDLKYAITNNIRQGWDFTIRRICYKSIPDVLKVFYGDDYLFDNVYKMCYKSSYILSSPVIHYLSKSHQYLENKNMILSNEAKIYKDMDCLKFSYDRRFSKLLPTFTFFDIKQ
jgi:hypothetical protein